MSIQGQKTKTFFIEGGDNVGKTTTINKIKKVLSPEMTFKLLYNTPYKDIVYHKYPSSEMTEFMNTYTKLSNIIKQKFNYDITNTQLTELAMHCIIKDMKDVLITTYGDKINICDRGILSTYLYQFLNYAKLKYDINNTNTLNETMLLKIFINDILNKTFPTRINTDINVIILYNNSDNKLNIDESETIEYKKNFDHNQSLQDNINRSLNNIVASITENETISQKPFKICDITFHRVNIYEYIKNMDSPKYIPVRKTDLQLSDEIINIIIESIEEDKNEE